MQDISAQSELQFAVDGVFMLESLWSSLDFNFIWSQQPIREEILNHMKSSISSTLPATVSPIFYSLLMAVSYSKADKLSS